MAINERTLNEENQTAEVFIASVTILDIRFLFPCEFEAWRKIGLNKLGVTGSLNL